MARKGRKNAYTEIILPRLEEIKKLISEGTSEKEIAGRLGISYTTWKEHKKNQPAFSAILKDSRCKAIEDIERAMYDSATGITKKVRKAMKLKTIIYENGKRAKEEERVEYYDEEIFIPPSVAAAQFLLKNWAKEKYSNNPAELRQRQREFEFQKQKEW